MLKEIEDYNWGEAFGPEGARADTPEPVIHGDPCSTEPITREDVVKIKHIREGEHDGDNWLLVAKVKDGRWFFLTAGCDYTGWG